jgi:hypothetical protein
LNSLLLRQQISFGQSRQNNGGQVRLQGIPGLPEAGVLCAKAAKDGQPVVLTDLCVKSQAKASARKGHVQKEAYLML